MTADLGDVRIRRAEPGDEPAVAELLEELDRSQGGWRVFEPRASLRSELMARYRAIDGTADAIHLVAERDGEVVGMGVGVVHRPSSVSDALALEVSSFVVSPALRGRGIGRSLLERLAQFARERGVRSLDLRVFAANELGVDFWRSHGFRPRIVQMVAPVDEVAGPS
jgi:ribosomal protein S18 acetylase RimI-like enzyme